MSPFHLGFEKKWKCSSRIISVPWNCWWSSSVLMGWRDQQDVKVSGSISITSYFSKPQSWAEQNWNRKIKILDCKEIARWSTKDKWINEDPASYFLLFHSFNIMCDIYMSVLYPLYKHGFRQTLLYSIKFTLVVKKRCWPLNLSLLYGFLLLFSRPVFKHASIYKK